MRSAPIPPLTTSPVLRRILLTAQDAWDHAVASPFIHQATTGTLPDDVLARYLLLEDHFVQTSARVRAAAILNAPTPGAMDGHRKALTSLMDQQHPYLAQTLHRLNHPTTIPAHALQQAELLSSYALQVARAGDYPRILTAMTTAEELYATWCSQAGSIATTRNPVLTKWIQLHTTPPFTDELSFLIGELESIHPTEPTLIALGECASTVLDLEVSFHDAAYLV